ncbi:biotin/lipoyl-containing protein [Blastococcus sp. CT_GayMR19]|uniref:acetyl-CoA carboxylase biotin carboxyl carrier protein n=1 Tax=Blastococcus sp. CT_GayMR19 TaxID=2559608 RepID=UPI00142F48D7|nr:biotin/lipoyl-containing protein [Blastococcus sp. CT_GayMR19]
MELTHDDVVSILELLERSNVEYLEVEVGSSRIVADRTGVTTQARGRAPVPAAAAPVAAPAPVVAPAPAPVAAPAPPAGTAPPVVTAPPVPPQAWAAPVAADLVTVTAPMLGVFFRAPQPGAPNFVEVGSQIEEGATLGLVEVMKMYNGVASPTAGEVVEVLAANEEFVEYGQPLFRLRPAVA